MASDEEIKRNRWLDEEGELFEISGQCPAPSKDFCQLVVSPTQVIFRWWKISHRQSEVQRLHPGEIKESHHDFLVDDGTQGKITSAFGQNMTDYVINLCKGNIDYLERLPETVIRRIFLQCDLRDVGRLAQVNKHFHKLCNEEDFWRSMFAQSSAITDDIESLAKKKGWKNLYFSDKLKIQVQLSRKRKRNQETTGGSSATTTPRVTRSKRVLSANK